MQLAVGMNSYWGAVSQSPKKRGKSKKEPKAGGDDYSCGRTSPESERRNWESA